VLFAVFGSPEVLAAIAPFGKLVPGLLTIGGVPYKDRDKWRAHSENATE
jgi:hypothetical protein